MKSKIIGALIGALAALPGLTLAAVSAEEAARLGTTLTPIGAEKAGNADGSIPAWTGGQTTAVPGFVPGGHYPDPYADDRPLFTITAANAQQYRDKLSPGQLALLQRYPTWKM
jgi:hypothetical protein